MLSNLGRCLDNETGRGRSMKKGESKDRKENYKTKSENVAKGD